MGQYRYVGSAPAQIMDTPFSFQKYGQLVEMPDELVKKVIIEGRIALIPASEFDGIGHPDKELQFHSRFETHADGAGHPDHKDFHLRKAHAWTKVAGFRDKLVTGEETEENTDA